MKRSLFLSGLAIVLLALGMFATGARAQLLQTKLFVENASGLTSITGSGTGAITLPAVTGTAITTGNLSLITATGTIASGLWNGTAIGTKYGGTGMDFSGSTGYLLLTGGTASISSTIPGSAISGAVANATTAATANLLANSDAAGQSAITAINAASTGTINAARISTLNQSTTGNAATVTTNANLTGPVTSSGNATAIAANALSEAMVNNLTTDLGNKAAKGANSDITSLTGLTTALSAGQGGTGTTSAPTSGQILVGQAGSVYAPKTFADVQTAAANPTAITSSTGEMAGLSHGTSIITPTATGKVQIIVTGTIAQGSNGATATVGIRYGSGTAPAHGDSPTAGSAVGSVESSLDGAGKTLTAPFSCTAYVSGLSLNTAYWVDAVVSASAGNVTITNVEITAIELP